MKKCVKCGKKKELTEFYSRGNRVYNTCKSCEIEYRRQFKKANPKKVKERDRKYALKKLYGMTVDEYNKLFMKQKGRCSICDKHQSEFNKSLFVDHCHITNTIRGLLCANCNLMIGNSLDNPDTLIKGAKYLRMNL